MIDHINLKIFAQVTQGATQGAPNGFRLADAIPVFHQWIREAAVPEMLIDVADYEHVHAGPGILLIGHQANYSLDDRDNRLGLLYNRKAVLEGTMRDKLAQAHQSALNACDRLEKDLPLKFNRNVMELFINDRLLAPNTEETWTRLQPELKSYFQGHKLARIGEPRDLFRVSITA